MTEQPGTITAEHHQRIVREAVKAAYERAAERCRIVSMGDSDDE